MTRSLLSLKRRVLWAASGILALALPVCGFAEEPATSQPAASRHERPYLFSRSQLKYGLERDDYLGRWVDRPLFVDPTLQKGEPAAASINAKSYRQMQEMARRYGLDGFAFFPEVTRTREVYGLTRANAVPGFFLLSEFGSRGSDEEKIAIAGMALDNPAAFRLDGKVVFTSYGADRKTPGYWKNLLQKLKERHGDHFIFLPAIVQFAGKTPSYWGDRFEEGSITPEEFESVKASLREWLRATDGLYFASPTALKKDRRFDQAFYRDFVIKAMKETLAEPEFSGKYFALSAAVGHENCTRFGYTLNSSGTKTLRESLETAIDARPDLINIPEWDEQNENTSLRPTVYNSLSSLRLLAYYSAKLRGELPQPQPGDDVSIPNLVVSYRKLLTLGEKLEVELLNVPDSASRNDEYSVRVTLADQSGKIVYTSPSLPFRRNELKDHTVSLPSEAFAGCTVLVPTVETSFGKEKRAFSDGLHYIALRPSWNWDYKWVKQPLRDLLAPVQCRFSLSRPEADGRRVVSVELEAKEPLAQVEVLDNDDVVYSCRAGENPSWREDENQAVISLSWQAMKLIDIDGSLTLKNAPGARWLFPKEENVALKGETLSLNHLRVNHWSRQILVAIPRSEVENAAFEISLKPFHQSTLPVRKIVEESIHGIAGPDGFNLVLRRYLRQEKIPDPIGANAVRFAASVLPDLPGSVFHVQAIGKSGRTYRSRPVAIEAGGEGKTSVPVYSESAQKPVAVDLESGRVPDLNYRFNPRHGSILYTEAGRPFWGILGGFVTQATGRGGGESLDGNPFLKQGDYPGKTSKTAPDWVEEADGGYALEFDGKGTFVTLPQGAIPRRSGFAIYLEIKPETTNGKEIVLANRSYYPGLITVYLDNGILKARFSGERTSTRVLNSRLPLEAGKWANVSVRYDQSHLWFAVDGKTSERFPIPGPGLYDTVSVLGGFGDEWFKGKIRAFRVTHTPGEE